MSFIINPYRFVDLTAGLVGHWKFNDDATDSSPSGNNGTAVGSPTYVTGHLANAISLNGSAQYVNTNESSDYDFGLTDFTYAFWMKTSTLARRVIGTYLTPLGWSMYLNAANGNNIGLFVYGSLGGITNYTNSNQATFSTGVWQHVLVTNARSGNNVTQKVFVQGIESGTALSGTVGDIASSGNLLIGTYLDSEGSFNGELDDVRIYNKVLNAIEIAALYAL